MSTAAFNDDDRIKKVNGTAETVQELFKKYMVDARLPGLAYGVLLDGELIYSGGFGYANLEKRLEANTRSLFRIASMSKSITALSVLQLRDAGKLILDEPASKYVPEMTKLSLLTADAPEITIRNLLTHGAGFPQDDPWADRHLSDSDEELMQLIEAGVSFSNVPEVTYEYSNLGFALLGQIVQRVSGLDFQQFTRENILEPLGMHDTLWEYSKAAEDQLALGYDWIDESYIKIPLEHHGAFGAMGGLITSIEDFAKYVAFHQNAWPPRSHTESGPLKRSSLREMHHPWRFVSLLTESRDPTGRFCPQARAYGYGLVWTSDCDARVSIGHSGGLPGYGSNWAMMRDYGLAVMSFDNRTYGVTNVINEQVMNTVVSLAELQPRAVPSSDILKKRQAELIKFFPDWSGAEQSGLFAENFFLDNRLKDLVLETRDLYRKAGDITRIGELRPSNQLRGTFVLEAEDGDIEVFFTLTPEKVPLIQELRTSLVENKDN